MKVLISRFFSVAALSLVGVAVYATAGGDIRSGASTSVATCTARNSKCGSRAGRVNAIGDVVVMDVNEEDAQDLGTIEDETLVTFELPQEPGSDKLYSMTPTSGESSDTKIYLLFRNIEQAPGTRLAGKTVVLAYRHFEGQDSDEWVEVGRLITTEDLPEAAEVTLTPDAVAKVPNPMDPEETIVFEVGKKDL